MVTDYRNYIWGLPIIGGVLVLISFFTPAAFANSFGIQEHYWMWGLSYQSIPGYMSRLIFIPLQEPSQFMLPVFLIGIIPAILIFICSIKFVASGNAVRRGRRSIKNLENLWIGLGIMLILAAIIYMIGIDITITNYLKYQLEQFYGFIPQIPSFWSVYSPGFALIASFIGGALAIISGVVSKMIKPREEPIRNGELKKFITKLPVESIEGQVNYCPECGQELLYKKGKFCVKCGFEIRI